MPTYVQITRDELETWLESLPLHGRWKLQTGRAGVYLLPLSDNVGIKLSSTIGSSDDAMGRGEASMQLALISLVTGKVLNKKAQGQDHFKRTTNWRITWRKGFDRIKEAYLKSQGFYDAIAVIEDREKYKKNILDKIEKDPNWQVNNILQDFHRRVQEGGILTSAQEGLLHKILQGSGGRSAPGPTPSPASAPASSELLDRLRKLYVEARTDKNQWLMDFVESVGKQIKSGRPLSQKQQDVIDRAFTQYRLASAVFDLWAAQHVD